MVLGGGGMGRDLDDDGPYQHHTADQPLMISLIAICCSRSLTISRAGWCRQHVTHSGT